MRRTARATTVVLMVALAVIAASTSGASEARVPGRSVTPVTLPARAITKYDVTFDGGRQILYHGGSVWLWDGSTLHRVALGSEPIIGAFANPGQQDTVFSGGKLWTLGLDDHECAPSNFPYLLRSIDPATSAVTSSEVLPGWCRYEGDNRDPWPFLVAGGGELWLTIATADGGGTPTTIVTVDTASGSVSVGPAPGVLHVFAADQAGAWTAGGDGTRVTRNNKLGLDVASGIRLGRLDRSGHVAASDLLPHVSVPEGPGGPADRSGLWVTYATNRSKPGAPQQIALEHVTPAGKVVIAKGVSPWSVGTGDGEVWFLGTVGRAHASRPRSGVDWVLGEIDPHTYRVRRAFHLDLALDPSAETGALPSVHIGAVMDGAVWIENGARRLFRVSVDRR